MSFLQPWLLSALPLILLPLIIHLINQRRFQTIQWAAMMFLLAANRMSRGYSRLRQWLIMLFRMLAIAGLLIAAARPLASGWLGLASGGRPDTTVILLDRSPSMQQRGSAATESKLTTGLQQLISTLQVFGSGRWVLIDSASRIPHELESIESLVNVPEVTAVSGQADLPTMLQSAYDYLKAHPVGRTEIWICSDLQETDWDAASGRWATLRDAFQELPQGARFHLLSYSQRPASNTAIRVTQVRRANTTDGAELMISLKLQRQGATDQKTQVPIEFELDGARSVVTIELDGSTAELKDHHVPIEKFKLQGWGRVSIPADENPADDDFYFVFDQPAARRTVIVADDPAEARSLQIAASISSDPSLQTEAEIIETSQLAAQDWSHISLVIWYSSLPAGSDAEALEQFVNAGGMIVFFPPENPNENEIWGVQWRSLITPEHPVPVVSWRSDEDLLNRTQSGTSLPVGQLQVHRYHEIHGNVTHLATLSGGNPLLARIPTEKGGVYFWSTSPQPRDSTLANNGIVLFAVIQRALSAGAESLKKSHQLDAGPGDEQSKSWQRLAGTDQSLSIEQSWHRGVYSSGDQLIAVNRPTSEDEGSILRDDQSTELFRGLNFVQIDDRAGNLDKLVQEVWRLFLISMLIALLLEAILCFPKVTRTARVAA